MKKTIFFPLYNYSVSSYDDYPFQMMEIDKIYFVDFSDNTYMVIISTETDMEKEQKVKYIVPMSVKEYNKVMSCLFDNDVIWLSKCGILEEDKKYSYIFETFIETNEKISFSVIGRK